MDECVIGAVPAWPDKLKADLIRFVSRALMVGAGVLASSLAAMAQTALPVLQRGYDAGVSGANLTETTLNTSNVTPSTFGLIFPLAVDDNVFAQPLYVPNVAVAGQGTHNVLYVATMSDTLYAFDADVGAKLWSVNFASRVGATPVPIANFAFSGNRNITGNLGILSTPVIDPATNVMYLVAGTLENNTIAYRLHAVDITSGAEMFTAGAGVVISGSYGGANFNGRYQTQRVSLALSGNQVVFAFGAVELEYAGGYVGWVMAYDKTSLAQSGIFATVTAGTGGGGGVWQSGRPPVVDSSGFIYVFVGNAYSNGYDGTNNFSESVLKLDPANHLGLVDWFTPGNWSTLDNQDLDLTSSGPMLIPGTSPSLLAGGGKTGDLYVLNTSNLGKYNANDSQVVQKQRISNSEFRGGPVFWQRSTANGGPLLYNWGVSDAVKAYAFNGTQFAGSPSSQGNITNQIFPGGILALSANGETPGSGILWATVATSGDAENNPPVPGELHAFNAENLGSELWNSAMNSSRDSFGNFAKFVPPLVVGGRVYVATFSNQVAVYGLLSAAPPRVLTSVTVAPASASVQTGGTVQFTATGLDQFGKALSPQPTFAWSVSGGGTISASGLFTAGSGAGGPFGVTATSGGISGTAGVTVTSVPPDYSISISPASASVKRGQAASYTVAITPINGFTGSVTLSLSGQPSGSTITFTPNPVTVASTLKVATSPTTPKKKYTLTVKGTSGSLTHTSTASLTVTR